MTVFESLQNIQASPTMAVTQRARELREGGADVLALGAGEPDFATPDFVQDAIVKALHAGETRYTPVDGTPALKKAVIDKFARENNLTYNNDQITAGTGGKQICFNALAASLKPREEVLIPAPYWVSYPAMTILAGGVPKIIECPRADGYKLTPKTLAATITNKTRWLILNSPNNPTGAAYHHDELAALAEVLRKHPKVWVLSDDIYEHIIYDDFVFHTLAQVAPDLADRILIVNGVSKSYAMTGLRLGYGAGPASLIGAIRKLQSHTTSNPSSISQAGAVAALNGPQDFLYEWREAFRRRRDACLESLQRAPGITCTRPEGAFYLFADVTELVGTTTPDGQAITDDVALCRYLLEDKHVAVVPGTAFGMAGHFRLSYATSDAILAQACERIAKAAGTLKGSS
ncbi:MAG: pyridoxal phosphate-dependent aminotransferase [Pseudomonadota bacterium]